MEIGSNTSWAWMILMAFSLGIRHGLDLDHLATIDAITRTVRNDRFLSKMVGLLFSLGHGLVIILISLIIGSGLMKAHIPEWLDGLGSWISIFFLVLFGAINLWNVFHQSPSSTLPVGLKSFLAKRLSKKEHTPAMVILIGVLFAFSFDTFSQIALFSISASLLSGWLFSGVLGLFFMFGMMISDGLNGLFVSTILQRADKASLIVSKSLGIAISIFSLIIAFISIFKAFF